MTGFDSKRQAAQAKVRDDDDTQVYEVYADTLLIVYQRGFADGKAAQRTWVGLDEDDIRKLYGKDLNYRDGNYVRYAMAVEAKLKAKNGY